MFAGVGERPLHDAKDRQLHAVGHIGRLTVDLQLCRKIGRHRLGDGVAEVRHAGLRFERRVGVPGVPQHAEHSTKLRQRVTADPFDVGQHLDRLVGIDASDLLRGRRLDGDDAHAVGDDVVNLPSDSLTFVDNRHPGSQLHVLLRIAGPLLEIRDALPALVDDLTEEGRRDVHCGEPEHDDRRVVALDRRPRCPGEECHQHSDDRVVLPGAAAIDAIGSRTVDRHHRGTVESQRVVAHPVHGDRCTDDVQRRQRISPAVREGQVVSGQQQIGQGIGVSPSSGPVEVDVEGRDHEDQREHGGVDREPVGRQPAPERPPSSGDPAGNRFPVRRLGWMNDETHMDQPVASAAWSRAAEDATRDRGASSLGSTTRTP